MRVCLPLSACRMRLCLPLLLGSRARLRLPLPLRSRMPLCLPLPPRVRCSLPPAIVIALSFQLGIHAPFGTCFLRRILTGSPACPIGRP